MRLLGRYTHQHRAWRSRAQFHARAGDELLPGLVAEGALVGRSIDDALRGPTRQSTALLQLRWGLPFRSVRY